MSNVLDSDAIERVAIDDVRGAARNVKTHDLDLIAASIRRFGFADPLVVDRRTGELLAGHGRLEALLAMREAGEPPPEGITDAWEAPVYTGWASRDDAEADAARVALNRSSEVGGWDEPALLGLLDRLTDLDGVGFGSDDLDALRARLDGTASGGFMEREPLRPFVRTFFLVSAPVDMHGEVWDALARVALIDGVEVASGQN